MKVVPHEVKLNRPHLNLRLSLTLSELKALRRNLAHVASVDVVASVETGIDAQSNALHFTSRQSLVRVN